MKTKFFLLALLTLLASSEVCAFDFFADGIYYDISGSNVSVTNDGDLYDDYDSYSGNVTIPSSVTRNNKTYSVTSIGQSAFSDCYNLTSVTIPNSVTSIGNSAFAGCSLTFINIPNSVKTIGNSAFAGCGLTSVTIPNSVTIINSYAFQNCSALTSVTIGNSVTNIGNDAFYRCFGLTSITVTAGNTKYDSRNNCNAIIETATNTLVTGCKNTVIPNSVTSIGGSAFSGCSGLTSVDIPNSVTSIGDYAFSGCSGLTSVDLPNSVTSIGNSAFSYCSNLIRVNNFSVTPRAISSSTFSNRTNATLYVPKGSKATYEAANYWKEFKEIEELPVVSFADDNVKALCVENWDTNGNGEIEVAEAAAVTSIGTVFRNNTSITSFDELQYFTGLTTIVWYAFQNCSSLTSITIPNNVTSIGESAFQNCSNLTSVTIPESVTSIGISAFKDCSDLTSITIPSNVTSISSYAFQNCSSLTSITIPESVTSIGDNAFWDCSGLTSVTIPNSVTSINGGAFRNCSSLMSITIPNNVTSIGGYAFSGCSSLTSVTIPQSVTSLGHKAFSDCSSLMSVTLNSNAVVSRDYAGSTYCIALVFGSQVQEYIIGDEVTSIGNYAFRDCSDLTSVTIGNSVTNIGNDAFSRCSKLTSINIASGNTTYDSRNNCNAIIETATNTLVFGCKNTIIPNSVTSIGGWAFYDCTSLTSITIPNSVTSIGNSAFYGCSSLTSVNVLAETPSSIQSTTFPSTIAKIRVPEASVSAYKAATNWSAFSAKIIALGGEDNSITVEEIEANKAAGGSANQTYIVTDAAADDVKAANNVIVHSGDNYTCANLVLSDGEPFETMAEEFTATAATYTRSVSVGNTSGTICVPYAFAKEDGVKYYTVDNTRSDDETIYLSEVAEDIIPAATPVIYIKGSGKTTMTFSGSNAVAKKTAGTGSGTFELRGTFEKTTITESDELAKSYALSGGKFLCSTTKLTINPFRAYLYNTGAVAGARLDMSVDDEEPTGITSENAALMSGDAEIEGYYTLDGKRVGSLQKGAVTVIRYANGKSVKVFAR